MCVDKILSRKIVRLERTRYPFSMQFGEDRTIRMLFMEYFCSNKVNHYFEYR